MRSALPWRPFNLPLVTGHVLFQALQITITTTLNQRSKSNLSFEIFPLLSTLFHFISTTPNFCPCKRYFTYIIQTCHLLLSMNMQVFMILLFTTRITWICEFVWHPERDGWVLLHEVLLGREKKIIIREFADTLRGEEVHFE